MTETAETKTEATTASTTASETTETTTTEQQTTSTTEAAKTLLGEASTETKTDAKATTETTTEETKAETKVEGAPEKYEFKAPEGKEYDPNLLGSFSEAAKEANLTQEAAQKFIDKMAPVLATRQAEQVQTIQTEWIEASKADKEFGGDKFQENMAIAKKGYDTFASPELRQLLETTGLGNHPEVIRHFVHVGKAISEDKFVSGGAAVADSQENRFYPTMTKK